MTIPMKGTFSHPAPVKHTCSLEKFKKIIKIKLKGESGRKNSPGDSADGPNLRNTVVSDQLENQGCLSLSLAFCFDIRQKTVNDLPS